MSIEWLRDLSISIYALVATGVLIFVAVLAYMCCRAVNSAAEAVKEATRRFDETVTTVQDEVIRPAVQILAFIQGMRQAIAWMIKKWSAPREGEGGGKNG